MARYAVGASPFDRLRAGEIDGAVLVDIERGEGLRAVKIVLAEIFRQDNRINRIGDVGLYLAQHSVTVVVGGGDDVRCTAERCVIGSIHAVNSIHVCTTRERFGRWGSPDAYFAIASYLLFASVRWQG